MSAKDIRILPSSIGEKTMAYNICTQICDPRVFRLSNSDAVERNHQIQKDCTHFMRCPSIPNQIVFIHPMVVIAHSAAG